MRFFLLLAITLPLQAEERRLFQSGDKQAHLVELFTSEGCSSCPAADRYFSNLRKQNGLWSQVVPLGFHVPYWDHLGWKDPLANQEFSVRQSRHARRWKTDRIYTPGLVLNGREWRGWRGGRLPAGRASAAGKLDVTYAAPGNLAVVFSPRKKGMKWDIHAALLGNGYQRRIRAGENRGSTLRHDFAVLDLKKTRGKPQKNFVRAQFRLKRPADKPRPKTYSVAVWVTPQNSDLPVQAVGGDI